MTNHVSGMPLWAILLFITSFLYCIAFITGAARQAALGAGMAPRKARNIQFAIFGFYIIFLAYVSFFSLRGVFEVDALPPKVTVWAGLPLAVFLFGFIWNTGIFKTLLRSITLESLITVHVFRVLGIFFIFLYGYHLLPPTFAFFAGLGDVITAALAWPVARMVAKRHAWWKFAVYVWNIFGIMDIIDLLTVAVITTSAGGNLREMTVFPFSWFPAFAPATILFLHAAVFKKLDQMSNPAGHSSIS